jgi:hypothetical protein
VVEAVVLENVITPLAVSVVFERRNAPEVCPSNVSASKPLPAPSTVFSNVNISLAVWSAVASVSPVYPKSANVKFLVDTAAFASVT